MKRLFALPFVLIAGSAVALETRTYRFRCKGGEFSVTATVDRSKGYEAWVRPFTLNLPGQAPKALTPVPDNPGGELWANREYEFSSFKRFTNLSRNVNGIWNTTHDACQWLDRRS